MTKNKDNIEKKLLCADEIDELISVKINRRIENEINQAKKEKTRTVINEFEQVPKSKTFSPKSVYPVFNRKTQRESFINGIQADSLIGLHQEIRNNLLERYCDNFTVGEYYVRFKAYTELC